jgi:hypothetical protein
MNMTSIMYEVISTVAFGGNVLINVGPTHDGAKNGIFLSHLYIQCIFLPRQARDKHRETQKRVAFCAGRIVPIFQVRNTKTPFWEPFLY